MQVSRSGYYAWLTRPESNRKPQDRKLLKKIRKVYKVSRGTYGSPRITRALRKQGITCGKSRVTRLMRENDIVSKTKRKFQATTNSKHNYPVVENLLSQNFNAERPNQIWGADITCHLWIYWDFLQPYKTAFIFEIHVSARIWASFQISCLINYILLSEPLRLFNVKHACLVLDNRGPRAWYDIKPGGNILSHASWSRPVGNPIKPCTGWMSRPIINFLEYV